MKPFVFLTGMFRSGTTLLARMLNAHPNIAGASDPYQPTLKAYRNAVWRRLENGGEVDEAAPFDDYHFYPEKLALMDAVAATGLELPVGDLDLGQLRRDTAAYAHDFSPKIEPHLDHLGGETFADLIRTGVEIIERAYGGPDTRIAAFKITWSDEFSRLLLDAFPEAKTIHIVRDPRAVCASKYALEGAKYPFLFMIRHWRKLVGIARRNEQPGSGYEDRTLVVRYEDLVGNTPDVARRMCDFMGVPFSEQLLDAGGFKDGAGRTWEQNTSYTDKHAEISRESVERWRRVLSEEQIALVEHLCAPEMALLGYEPSQPRPALLPPDLVTDPPEVPRDQLAKWIVPYTRLETHTLLHDMALEAARLQALAGRRQASPRTKRLFAHEAAWFDQLSEALSTHGEAAR